MIVLRRVEQARLILPYSGEYHFTQGVYEKGSSSNVVVVILSSSITGSVCYNRC